ATDTGPSKDAGPAAASAAPAAPAPAASAHAAPAHAAPAPAAPAPAHAAPEPAASAPAASAPAASAPAASAPDAASDAPVEASLSSSPAEPETSVDHAPAISPPPAVELSMPDEEWAELLPPVAVPVGDPDSPASPPGKAPPGDSRSFRRFSEG